MTNNNDEAWKCIKLAETEMANGNYEKAIRFLNRSLKMSPNDAAKKLLAECESHSKNEEKKERGYGDEDAKIADEVIKKTDYYEILSVHKAATDDEIKKQYKKLALKLHPDKNHAPQATDAFKKLSQAFACLSDKTKRQVYDEHGSEENFRQRYQQNFAEEEMDPEDLFDLLFNGAMNPNRRRTRFYRQGNVYYYTENLGRHADGERRRFGPLAQLLPLLMILFLGLLLQFKGFGNWGSSREYSFNPTNTFRHYRMSEKTGIKYFVGDDFEAKYLESREKFTAFEKKVEEEYLELLWRQCSNARWQRTVLEERKFYARGRDKERAERELNALDMSSCTQYTQIKNKRSQ